MIPDSPRPISKPRLWTGRILSGVVVAVLLLDAGAKLAAVQPVMDGMRQLGFRSTPELARGLGALLIACTVLYAVPRTALLGAVLLTGFLGGTIAIHLRLGHPILTHILFGGYIGILLWVGLCLRQPALVRLLRFGMSGPRLAG